MRNAALPASRRASLRLSLALITGLCLTGVVVAAALISFVWTPWDVEAIRIVDRLQPPSPAHWMGTDHFGRDVLSMIFAFPALLVAVMITAVFGPGAINAIIAIGIFNIPVFARVSRGAALSLWAQDYVLAARTAGKSRTLISVQHILPNLLSLLMVQAAIQFALGIVAEAGLSYVGLGAQPPMPSWGRMLSEAQTMIGFAPWLAIFPGLAIVTVVLGLSLTGDSLGERLDPRLRGGRNR